MPTNRRRFDRTRRHITPEAIAAWQRADFHALHHLLGLKPWEASPLPYEITVLGCSEDDLPLGQDCSKWDKTLPKAVALQKQFLAVAGWPHCRKIYEEQLHDAEEHVAYCREQVEHPPQGAFGTGCGLESRQETLEDILAEVEYRQELLAGLDAVQRKWAPGAR